MGGNEGVEAVSNVAPEKIAIKDGVYAAPSAAKKWVMTEARRLAFEKCKAKRKENCERLQKGKQLLKLTEREKKIQEKKEALKA
eukprot:40371-Eustigmatos_ZCMA.PRE.1